MHGESTSYPSRIDLSPGRSGRRLALPDFDTGILTVQRYSIDIIEPEETTIAPWVSGWEHDIDYSGLKSLSQSTEYAPRVIVR